MVLNNSELSLIVGGAWTATMLNAISRGISTLFKLGYELGSTIKRIVTRTGCRV